MLKKIHDEHVLQKKKKNNFVIKLQKITRDNNKFWNNNKK